MKNRIERFNLSPRTQNQLAELTAMLCAEIMLTGDRNLKRISTPTQIEFAGMKSLEAAARRDATTKTRNKYNG